MPPAGAVMNGGRFITKSSKKTYQPFNIASVGTQPPVIKPKIVRQNTAGASFSSTSSNSSNVPPNETHKQFARKLSASGATMSTSTSSLSSTSPELSPKTVMSKVDSVAAPPKPAVASKPVKKSTARPQKPSGQDKTLTFMMSPVYKARITKNVTVLQKYARAWAARAQVQTLREQHRLHMACCKIQARVRGNQQRVLYRQAVAVRTLQAVVRGFCARRRFQKRAYAVKIQACYRGYAKYMPFRFKFLTWKLERNDKVREEQLEEIASRKQAAMRRFQAEVMQEVDHEEENQAKIEEAEGLVEKMRQKNKELRERNETYESAMEGMEKENHIMELALHQKESDMAELEAAVPKFQEQINFWLGVLKKYEERRLEFNGVIESRQELVEFEQTTKKLFGDTIMRMVDMIAETSTQQDLRDYILMLGARVTVDDDKKADDDEDSSDEDE